MITFVALESFISDLMTNNYSLSISDQRFNRTLQVIGHGFCLVFLLGCIYYFKERMLHFDSPFYAYNLLLKEDFYIPHNRTINYLTELLPLLAIKLNWSLQSVLMSYSLSYALLLYGIYLVITYGFKNPAGGIFLALVMCLAIRYKFYATISEIYFSFALGALFVGWMTSPVFKQSNSLKQLIGSALCAIFLFIGHPMMVVPISVFLAFDFTYHNKWKNGTAWLIALLVIGVYAYRFWSIPDNSYEAGKLNILEQTKEVWTNLYDYQAYHIIKGYFNKQLHLAVIATSLCLVWLGFQRKWLPILTIIAGTLGMIFLNILIYSYLSDSIYPLIDGYIGILGFIWAIPMLYVLKAAKWRMLTTFIVVALLIFSIIRISNTAQYFQQRAAFLTELMERNAQPDQRKLLLHMKNFKWKHLSYPWAVPCETLLLSSLEGNSATVFVVGYSDDMEKRLQTKTKFFNPAGTINIEKLPDYFNLDQNNYLEATDIPEYWDLR